MAAADTAKAQDGAKKERDAKSAYAAKFHIIDVKEKDGFKRCGIKGIEYPLKDPRSMRSDATPGKISFAFIVTPDGRVIEPRILHSTDASVTTYILQHYDNRRFFPAKFRGIAVSSLYFDEWPFGGQPGRDDQNFRNGLNIMGYRDR